MLLGVFYLYVKKEMTVMINGNQGGNMEKDDEMTEKEKNSIIKIRYISLVLAYLITAVLFLSGITWYNNIAAGMLFAFSISLIKVDFRPFSFKTWGISILIFLIGAALLFYKNSLYSDSALTLNHIFIGFLLAIVIDTIGTFFFTLKQNSRNHDSAESSHKIIG